MDSDVARDCTAAYDEWAATYDTIDNPLIAQATAVLADRAAWLVGARVLELGCGTGRNAPFCLAAGAEGYVGVDASAGMLAIARGRLADPRASFVEGDLASGAPVETGPFDLVLVCLVLEHLRSVDPVMAAAARALSPGGRLSILELHPALHARGIGANFRVGEREVRLPSFRHGSAELLAALEAVGLRSLALAEHSPTPAALARSPKLARYAGQPVLLEIAAERPRSLK